MENKAINFLWNGIKVDGVLAKAHYSIGSLKSFVEGTITIYGKGYKDLPVIEGTVAENNTDTMTDYFENDRIRISPDHALYSQVKGAYLKQEAHNAKRWAKKLAKIAKAHK